MSEALRARIGRYLDGQATAAERSAVEQALLEDATARIFAEEVLLRDLLRHAPPEVPPAEVVARWEAAVLGDLESADEDAPGWFTQTLDALGWSFRGAALSLDAGAEVTRLSMTGVRSALPKREPPPPLWRRLLRWPR
jgi:anti-sigma factor RsiW